MTEPSTGKLTRLLGAVQDETEGAADELYTLVYTELRGIAQRHVASGQVAATLQPTELVHEAYLRIAGRDGLEPTNTRHFFFALSRAMKDILVEHARKRLAAKRGGAWSRVALTGCATQDQGDDVDVLELYRALEELQQVDSDVEQVICMRCFAGLSLRKTAELLGVTLAAVRRDWDYGVAWLHNRMQFGDGSSSGSKTH